MIRDLLNYIIAIYSSIPIYVYILLLFVFFTGLAYIIKRYFEKKWMYISVLFLTEYLFFLICSTNIFRYERSNRKFEIKPFWSYFAIGEGEENLILENLMNILAFVPVGILIGFAFKYMNTWKVIKVGLVISIFIELMQYVFKRGFAEFDDIFHNVIGCIIGYLFYKLGFYLKERNTWRIEV